MGRTVELSSIRGLPSVPLAAILFSASMLLGSLAGAEDLPAGSLQGRVTRDGQGLPGVAVTAAGSVTAHRLTTLDGTYKFTDFPPGAYTLALTQDGLEGNPPLHTVALPGSVNRGFDFEVSAASPLLPTVRLAPSATSVRPGDTFILHMTLTPGTRESVADLYLVLNGPGSALPSQAPWQANLRVPQVTDFPVLSYTVTGSEALGTYTWLAFLTRPGTLDLLGPVASAAVMVQP